MNQTFRLVFIAAALATLAGCGNKGPLVLPTPPAEPVVAPEAPAETPPAEPATDGTTTPPEQTPVPATSDGGGNG
ncbi:LPS translocon maturation chaperone LptM [Lysobacter tyrosinilyticus]